MDIASEPAENIKALEQAAAEHANVASQPAGNITSRQDQEYDGYAEEDVALEQVVTGHAKSASEPAGNINQVSQDTSRIQILQVQAGHCSVK